MYSQPDMYTTFPFPRLFGFPCSGTGPRPERSLQSGGGSVITSSFRSKLAFRRSRWRFWRVISVRVPHTEYHHHRQADNLPARNWSPLGVSNVQAVSGGMECRAREMLYRHRRNGPSRSQPVRNEYRIRVHFCVLTWLSLPQGCGDSNYICLSARSDAGSGAKQIPRGFGTPSCI